MSSWGVRPWRDSLAFRGGERVREVLHFHLWAEKKSGEPNGHNWDDLVQEGKILRRRREGKNMMRSKGKR